MNRLADRRTLAESVLERFAQDPNSPFTTAERAEIEARGSRGPQQLNKYGELETIPLRESGAQVAPGGIVFRRRRVTPPRRDFL